MHRGIYRVIRLPLRMVNFCSRRRPVNIYRDKPRPKWQRWLFYGVGFVVLISIMIWALRDTTPIQFVKPMLEDLNAPRGELATASQIDDVYWRVSIREVNRELDIVCRENQYSVLTHKNVRMDGQRMKESYVHLCNPIKDIHAVVNARIVLTAAGKETVTCIETYANKTKHVVRKYPYSLKYVCAQTFAQRTRVVRDKSEACLWAHAVDIVESVWD